MLLNNIFVRRFRDIRDSEVPLIKYTQLLLHDTDLSIRLIPSRVCISILSRRDHQGKLNDIERNKWIKSKETSSRKDTSKAQQTQRRSMIMQKIHSPFILYRHDSTRETKISKLFLDNLMNIFARVKTHVDP